MFTVEVTATQRGAMLYRAYRAATVPAAYQWLRSLTPQLDRRGTVARFKITADHGQIVRAWNWERA